MYRIMVSGVYFVVDVCQRLEWMMRQRAVTRAAVGFSRWNHRRRLCRRRRRHIRAAIDKHSSSETRNELVHHADRWDADSIPNN